MKTLSVIGFAVGAAVVAVQSAGAEVQQVPIEEFNVPEMGFVCMADGLPSVWIEHAGPQGYVSYSQHDSADPAAFTLRNSVRSVTHESNGGMRQWTIVAEGAATATTEIAEGATSRIGLVIRLAQSGAMTADLDVAAGSLTRSERSCRRAPPRPTNPGNNP